MRSRGTHITMGQVLIALLIAVLVPLLFLIFRNAKSDYFEYDADQPYLTSVPSGRPVNNIGQQRSLAKERQNRQLDQRMYQFLELRKVE